MAQIVGTYERSALRVMKSTLQPDDVFVDVRAHVGYYVLICARLAKRVIAFEPNSSNCKFLHFNVLINRLKNVIAVRAAVSDFNGHMELYIPKRGGRTLTDQGTLVHVHTGSVEVSVVTLDAFFEHIDKPNVIKIDVEGAELNVIRGALRTIAKGVRLIIVEIHSSDVKIPIIELLQDLGYVVCEKGRFLFFFRSSSSSSLTSRCGGEKPVSSLKSKEMNESQNGSSEA